MVGKRVSVSDRDGSITGTSVRTVGFGASTFLFCRSVACCPWHVSVRQTRNASSSAHHCDCTLTRVAILLCGRTSKRVLKQCLRSSQRSTNLTTTIRKRSCGSRRQGGSAVCVGATRQAPRLAWGTRGFWAATAAAQRASSFLGSATASPVFGARASAQSQCRRLRQYRLTWHW